MNRGLKVLIVAVTSLVFPMGAHAQSWSTEFGAPPTGLGLNNDGWALLVYQDKLVVGGEFTQAGPIVANRVAAWDGGQWTALGSGIASGIVYDLTEYGGNIVAAGSPWGLMRWNGLVWTALTLPGGNQPLYTAHAHNGLLYVNPKVAGVSVLAAWNDSVWSTTLLPTTDSEVLDMCTYQGQLILAGGLPQFSPAASDRAGSSAQEDIVGFLLAWDGANFGGPGYSLVKVPYCLAVHESRVHVGAPLAAFPQAEMATWDGANAAAFGPLGIIEPMGLESFNGRLIVATTYGVTSFDGMTQVPLPGSPSGLSAVRLFQGSLYVTGWFTIAGQGESYQIARWSEPATAVGSSRGVGALRIDSAPNPFNPSVTLSVWLPARGRVDTTISTASGQIVRHFESGVHDAGSYQLRWDGASDNGTRMASGVYFARVVSGGQVATRKLVLLK